MFTNIPWSSYLLFVAFLLAAWYLFVGVRYYFAELQAIASGKIAFFQRKTFAEEQAAANPAPAAGMEALSSKLTEAIASAAAGNYGREEFLFLLQRTLKEFSGLKEASLRSAVNALILSECEKQGFIRLGDHELKLLWAEVA